MINFKEKYDDIKQLIDIILEILNDNNTTSCSYIFRKQNLNFNIAEIRHVLDRINKNLDYDNDYYFIKQKLNINEVVCYTKDFYGGIKPLKIIVDVFCLGYHYTISFIQNKHYLNSICDDKNGDEFRLLYVDYNYNKVTYRLNIKEEENLKFLKIEYKPIEIFPMEIKQVKEYESVDVKNQLKHFIMLPIDFDLSSEEFKKKLEEHDDKYIKFHRESKMKFKGKF